MDLTPEQLARMAEFLEAAMLVCFGFSWPFNIRKTLRQRSAVGKSRMFTGLVFIGYIAGILSKVIGGNVSLVTGLWALNALMVGADLVLILYYKHWLPARAAAPRVPPAADDEEIPLP